MSEYIVIPFRLVNTASDVGISAEHLASTGRKTLYYAIGGENRPDYAVVHLHSFEPDLFKADLSQIVQSIIASKTTLILLVDFRCLNEVYELVRSFGKTKFREKKRNDIQLDDSELKKQIAGSTSVKISLDSVLVGNEAIPMLYAKDIMISDVITIYDGSTASRAWEKLNGNNWSKRKIGHLPVLTESRHLTGIISETDLLPLLPPLGATSREEDEIFDRIARIPVTERMKKDVVSVTESGDINEILKKLCARVDGHRISLLPVVKSADDSTLVGVVSWVEVLRHWKQISANTNIQVTAGEIGTPVSEITQFEPTDTIAFIIESLKNSSSGARHFLVSKEGKPIRLVANRDILSYIPFGNENQHLLRLYYLTKIEDVPTSHSLDQISVPVDTPIGDETDPKSLIGKFIGSVAGDEEWHKRIDGILSMSVDEDGRIISLVTPFDCMNVLL